MKNVSFLVAFLAFLQVAAGSRAFGQDFLSDDARRTVEEALDLTGEDISKELASLVAQLELDAEQLSSQLENWVESNSDELEAWSDKHSPQWEAWGERFGKKLEHLTKDQENAWSQWAQGYEKNLERLTGELESSDLSALQLERLVKQNLKSISKMPLGQLVDQALEEGLGELGSAPWASLGELGELASAAVEEPAGDLARAISSTAAKGEKFVRDRQKADSTSPGEYQANAQTRREREFGQLKLTNSGRLRALKNLKQRGNLTDDELERVDLLMGAVEKQNADIVARFLRGKQAESPNLDPPSRIESPSREQLKTFLEREVKRHEDSLRKLKEELKQLRDHSQNELRKSDMTFRTVASRAPQGIAGQPFKLAPASSNRARQIGSQPFQRDGRDGKANRKPVNKITQR